MRVAIVGATGAVGRELSQLLKDSEHELIFFNSTSSLSFQEIELAFFCVSSSLAKALIPLARQAGAVCIDSSNAFRSDPTVPLVIPEINPEALHTHRGIIASPNCTTTLMLLPLAPLHREFQIKRIFAATYQAISGAGEKAQKELATQSRAFLENIPFTPEVFAHPCAFTVFPHEKAQEEERKMEEETHRILKDPSILVSAMCTRVPVFRSHSIAVNVEFARPITKEAVTSLIEQAQGVLHCPFPTSSDAENKLPVFCGRISIDKTQKNTLKMWIVGDQLLKGAALNMYQIGQVLSMSARELQSN